MARLEAPSVVTFVVEGCKVASRPAIIGALAAEPVAGSGGRGETGLA